MLPSSTSLLRALPLSSVSLPPLGPRSHLLRKLVLFSQTRSKIPSISTATRRCRILLLPLSLALSSRRNQHASLVHPPRLWAPSSPPLAVQSSTTTSLTARELDSKGPSPSPRAVRARLGLPRTSFRPTGRVSFQRGMLPASFEAHFYKAHISGTMPLNVHS